MTYIRMKNGKIYCFTGTHIVGNTIIGYVDDNDKRAFDGGTYIAKEKVVAQADTIEELCDEFVCVIPNKEKPYLLDKNTNLRLQANYIGDVFGAIWTDKGLIYVAKINSKGELELL